MAYSDFKETMRLLKEQYFTGNWKPIKRSDSSEIYDSLIQNLIKELYDYERSIKSFEEWYGTTSQEYYHNLQEYYKENNTLRSQQSDPKHAKRHREFEYLNRKEELKAIQGGSQSKG